MGAKRHLWCATIRPRHGVTDATLKKLTTCLNRGLHGFMVTEKVGEQRHAHLGKCYATEVPQSTARNEFIRCIEGYDEFDPPEKRFCHHIKHWYNQDFYSQYCDPEYVHKGDPPGETINLVDTLPADLSELPWAPEDDKADVRPSSPWYTKMAKLYTDEMLCMPSTEESVLCFLNRHMNAVRDIDVIADPRICQMKCRALVRFLNHYEGASYPNRRILTEMQEDLKYDTPALCHRCDQNKCRCSVERILYKKPPSGYSP